MLFYVYIIWCFPLNKPELRTNRTPLTRARGLRYTLPGCVLVSVSKVSLWFQLSSCFGSGRAGMHHHQQEKHSIAAERHRHGMAWDGIGIGTGIGIQRQRHRHRHRRGIGIGIGSPSAGRFRWLERRDPIRVLVQTQLVYTVISRVGNFLKSVKGAVKNVNNFLQKIYESFLDIYVFSPKSKRR